MGRISRPWQTGDVPALFPQRQVINVLRKDFPDDSRVFISDSELAPSLKISITFFAVFLRLHFYIPEGALPPLIIRRRGRYGCHEQTFIKMRRGICKSL
jgi:hypothetical protein